MSTLWNILICQYKVHVSWWILSPTATSHLVDVHATTNLISSLVQTSRWTRSEDGGGAKASPVQSESLNGQKAWDSGVEVSHSKTQTTCRHPHYTRRRFFPLCFFLWMASLTHSSGGRSLQFRVCQYVFNPWCTDESPPLVNPCQVGVLTA